MKKIFIIVALFTSACTTKEAPILEQNYADINVKTAKECKNKKLVVKEDGSLWIVTSSQQNL